MTCCDSSSTAWAVAQEWRYLQRSKRQSQDSAPTLLNVALISSTIDKLQSGYHQHCWRVLNVSLPAFQLLVLSPVGMTQA